MLIGDARAIYLDYAATTPVDPTVADAMSAYLTADGSFANPSSIHSLGRQAAAATEIAREHLAGCQRKITHDRLAGHGAARLCEKINGGEPKRAGSRSVWPREVRTDKRGH